MSIFCSHKVDHYNFGCPHCGTTVAEQEKRIAALEAVLRGVRVFAQSMTVGVYDPILNPMAERLLALLPKEKP